MKPLIIHNFLQSVRLLSDGMASFNHNCATGITANDKHIDEMMRNSLMLVTALVPKIGYDAAAAIAKKAHREGIALKEAAIASGHVTAEQFEAWVRPGDMIESR